jgi:hypothetical protein
MSTVLFLSLRSLHVPLAAAWIGATGFTSLLLTPAIIEAGRRRTRAGRLPCWRRPSGCLQKAKSFGTVVLLCQVVALIPMAVAHYG